MLFNRPVTLRGLIYSRLTSIFVHKST